MKKGWKRFFITCAVIFGVGVVFCIAGFAIGFNSQDMQSAMHKGFERFGLRGSTAYLEYENEKEIAVDDITPMSEELEFSGIQNLEIDIAEVSLRIIKTQGDTIRFASHLSEDCVNDVTAYQTRNTLVIHSKKDRCHHENHRGGEVLLYIPETLKMNEVEISVGAGEMEVEHLLASELDCEVGAGKLTIQHADVDRNMSLTCGMGEIEVVAEGNAKDFNYELEVGMGNVLIGEAEFGGMALEKTIQNSAQKNVEVECGMGNVEIGFTK